MRLIFLSTNIRQLHDSQKTMQNPSLDLPIPQPKASQDIGLDRKTLLGEALRRRIVNMELLPGAAVDEVTLAQEFGLSRPPVRELMRQLAAEGYLELEANRPARVSPMSYQSLRSYFQAAPLIYIATTQLAASHATAEEIASLKAIQEKFRKAMSEDDTAERVFYNDQFHYEIGKIARNAYLMPSLRRILIDHARLAQTFYRSKTNQIVPDDMQLDMQKAVNQHDQIIQAIEQRDLTAAKQLVQEHWELSRKRMAEYVMPDALDVLLQ